MWYEIWEADCKENFLRLSQNKSAQLSSVSPRFCNHSMKPFTFYCCKWATPARHNEFWHGEEMIWRNALFVVTSALINPVFCTLQRPCVEIETIYHDKTLKAIVYYLFILKHSFRCSSSCFCLFLVWLCFFECLVWGLAFNFPQEIL